MFTSVKFYERFGEKVNGANATGFHFITPCANTGRPVGTFGQYINQRIFSKGQRPDL
jgi:hypothetical protein